MSQLSDTEIRDEIMSVHKKVKELTGYEMFLFRPPYGDYDNEVITGVLSCGYYPIQWSIDSLDWKDYALMISSPVSATANTLMRCHHPVP